MDEFSKEKFIKALKSYSVMLLAGLFFLAVSLLFIYLTPDTADWVEVPGKIVRIESDCRYVGDDTVWEYDAFVDYTDRSGGIHKDVHYPYFDSSMKEGETVTVLYDPKDPDRIESPDGNYIPYIGVAVGSLVTLGSVYLAVKKAKEEAEN